MKYEVLSLPIVYTYIYRMLTDLYWLSARLGRILMEIQIRDILYAPHLYETCQNHETAHQNPFPQTVVGNPIENWKR